MKNNYVAPCCVVLSFAKEDILSLSNGKGINNILAEYSLAEYFEC